MNKDTAERLKSLVDCFDFFLELHPDDQDKLLPLLGRSERRTIEMLFLIQGKFLTYEQIASELELHISTVKTTLYALQAGGMTRLTQDKTGKWSTPKGGRYRALKKLGE